MKSEDQIREDWYKFENAKFVEFRGPTRKTISDFSQWVGISQPLMSQQLKKGGSVPRDQKTISAWVNRYGNEVYEVLGVPVPGDPLVLVPEPLRSISLAIRDTLIAKQIPADSPEAEVIMDEILKKFGYDLKEIRDEPLA